MSDTEWRGFQAKTTKARGLCTSIAFFQGWVSIYHHVEAWNTHILSVVWTWIWNWSGKDSMSGKRSAPPSSVTCMPPKVPVSSCKYHMYAYNYMNVHVGDWTAIKSQQKTPDITDRTYQVGGDWVLNHYLAILYRRGVAPWSTPLRTMPVVCQTHLSVLQLLAWNVIS